MKISGNIKASIMASLGIHVLQCFLSVVFGGGEFAIIIRYRRFERQEQHCASGGTRTPTGITPPGPKPGASASSATLALLTIQILQNQRKISTIF